MQFVVIRVRYIFLIKCKYSETLLADFSDSEFVQFSLETNLFFLVFKFLSFFVFAINDEVFGEFLEFCIDILKLKRVL